MSEHNEKFERIEMKTNRLGVMVSAAWPMLAAWGVLTLAILVMLPFSAGWPVIAAMGAVVLLTFLLFRSGIFTRMGIWPPKRKDRT